MDNHSSTPRRSRIISIPELGNTIPTCSSSRSVVRALSAAKEVKGVRFLLLFCHYLIFFPYVNNHSSTPRHSRINSTRTLAWSLLLVRLRESSPTKRGRKQVPSHLSGSINNGPVDYHHRPRGAVAFATPMSIWMTLSRDPSAAWRIWAERRRRASSQASRAPEESWARDMAWV